MLVGVWGLLFSLLLLASGLERGYEKLLNPGENNKNQGTFVQPPFFGMNCALFTSGSFLVVPLFKPPGILRPGRAAARLVEIQPPAGQWTLPPPAQALALASRADRGGGGGEGWLPVLWS